LPKRALKRFPILVEYDARGELEALRSLDPSHWSGVAKRHSTQVLQSRDQGRGEIARSVQPIAGATGPGHQPVQTATGGVLGLHDRPAAVLRLLDN
jgi:hypothetical protein